MKRKTNKIVFIILFFILISMNFYISEASEASISATNCTEGEKISVTITIPQDAVGYSGTNIYITYSDGTTSSVGRFSKLNYDFNTNTYSPAGNYTTSFDGKIAGNATIKVDGLVLTNSSNQQLNSNSSLSTTVYVAPKQVETPQEPETPPTNEGNTGNSNLENGNSGNGNSNSGSGGTTTENPKPVTTPKVLTFKDVNETVYTKRRINLRQNYGTTGGLIKTLSVDEELTRTGISTSADENGYYWSRVTYNGTTGYVITSGLTKDKPVENEIENNVENNINNEVENIVNEITNEVTNEVLNEVDGNELTKITEEIGVIPEVGNNIMINLFWSAIIVVSIMMIIVKKNKYENE